MSITEEKGETAADVRQCIADLRAKLDRQAKVIEGMAKALADLLAHESARLGVPIPEMTGGIWGNAQAALKLEEELK